MKYVDLQNRIDGSDTAVDIVGGGGQWGGAMCPYAIVAVTT